METVFFNRGSWHFKLACKVGFKYWRDGNDLCLYIRWVLWGMVVAALAACGASAITYAVGDALAWWAAMLINGSVVEANTPAGVVTILTVAIVITFVLHWLSHYVFPKVAGWWGKKEIDIPAPSFIAEAYKSFKSKTCRRVSFK